LTLCPLTATRTGESTGALWKEFDLDGAMWTIPGSRNEGKEAAPRALSRAAVKLLSGLERSGAFVFPA
jgi:hypothetical protein